jgi:hypothetical protein
MTPQAATGIAARMLDWMVSDPARLGAFLTATGLEPDQLRAGYGPAGLTDPALALALLDFVMSDEGLLLTTCHALDLPPDTPARAQAALGGGPGPHWT